MKLYNSRARFKSTISNNGIGGERYGIDFGYIKVNKISGIVIWLKGMKKLWI